MYYDLIYRQIERHQEQISQIAMQIEKQKVKNYLIVCRITSQWIRKNRLDTPKWLCSRKMDDYGFIMPFNNGTIAVEQNGQNSTVWWIYKNNRS